MAESLAKQLSLLASFHLIKQTNVWETGRGDNFPRPRKHTPMSLRSPCQIHILQYIPQANANCHEHGG